MIRKVSFEFMLPATVYKWAKWGTGDRVINNEAYFAGPLTNAKLIDWLKLHPQGGPAQQAQGYANQLSQDAPEHLLEAYLALSDADTDWTPKLTDKLTDNSYRTYWRGGKGTLVRDFYIWLANGEYGWVRMQVTNMPTGD